MDKDYPEDKRSIGQKFTPVFMDRRGYELLMKVKSDQEYICQYMELIIYGNTTSYKTGRER